MLAVWPPSPLHRGKNYLVISCYDFGYFEIRAISNRPSFRRNGEEVATNDDHDQ